MIVPREKLLSLEEDDLAWRNLLAWQAHELVGAVIAGRSAHQTALYQRLTHPVPGDYVFEVTTIWRKSPQGTGFLQKVSHEPYEEHDDDPPPTRDVWYVQYGPSDEDIVRWENCAFRVIPVDPVAFHKEVEEAASQILELKRMGRW